RRRQLATGAAGVRFPGGDTCDFPSDRDQPDQRGDRGRAPGDRPAPTRIGGSRIRGEIRDRQAGEQRAEDDRRDGEYNGGFEKSALRERIRRLRIDEKKGKAAADEK